MCASLPHRDTQTHADTNRNKAGIDTHRHTRAYQDIRRQTHRQTHTDADRQTQTDTTTDTQAHTDTELCTDKNTHGYTQIHMISSAPDALMKRLGFRI